MTRAKRKTAPKKKAAEIEPPIAAPPTSGETPRLGVLTGAPGFLLRRAINVFSNHYRQDLLKAGIPVTGVQGGMMILIDENPGLTQIELARLMAVEGSTLSLSLGRLLELSYVQRYRVPQDRRAFALHLTRLGRQVRARLDDLMAQHQNAVLSLLSTSERAQFIDFLQRIVTRGEELEKTSPDIGLN